MLSRRDEFAKAAMQGMLANQAWDYSDHGSACREAVRYADTLIAKLDEGQPVGHSGQLPRDSEYHNPKDWMEITRLRAELESLRGNPEFSIAEVNKALNAENGTLL